MKIKPVAATHENSLSIKEDWPKGIPHNNTELYRDYAAFVASSLRKHNKVTRNFDELLSYIWKRLIEKDILSLFFESINDKFPRHLNTTQVCTYLGVSRSQWLNQMRKYHRGTPVRAGNEFNPRFIVCQIQGAWMPTPYNIDELREVVREKIERRAKGKPIGRLKHVEPIFDINDVQSLTVDEVLGKDGRIRCMTFRKRAPQSLESLHIKPTKAHFISYLSKSIYSDFLNWCRTYRRKWAQDQPMAFREDNEEDREWEANLEDPFGMRQEAKTMAQQAITRISEVLHKKMRRGPSGQPIQQTEMRLFELLKQGVLMPDALHRIKIPEYVRREVLRSIEDIRGQAA
jgi:hypothetical protein